MFLLVGGTSSAAYICLSTFGVGYLNVRPGIAVVLALLITMPPTYLAQRTLSFRSARNHASALPRYFATQVAGNLVGIVAAEAWEAYVAPPSWLCFAAIGAIIALTNYVIHRMWTFSHA